MKDTVLFLLLGNSGGGGGGGGWSEADVGRKMISFSQTQGQRVSFLSNKSLSLQTCRRRREAIFRLCGNLS